MATRSKQQESDSEVEVLVHIGAPSLGPDDAKYRAMAAAYSNFKPAIRTKIPIRGGGGSQKQSQKQSQKSISETQFSFEDVDDNHASFVSLPSEVQDSMPDNLATFAGFVSPSRVLDFYTSSLESDSGGSQANRGAIQAKASLVGGAGGSSAGDSSAGDDWVESDDGALFDEEEDAEAGDEEDAEVGDQGGAKAGDDTGYEVQPADGPSSEDEDWVDEGFRTPPAAQGTAPDKSSSTPRRKFHQFLPEDSIRTGVPPPRSPSPLPSAPPAPELTSSEKRRLYAPEPEHQGDTPHATQPRDEATGIATTSEDTSSPKLPRSSRRDYHDPPRSSSRTPRASRLSDSSVRSSREGKTEGEEEGEEGDKDKTPRRLLFTKKRTPTSYPRDEIDPTDSDEPSLPVSSRKRPRADSSSQSPDPKRPRTAGPLAIDSSTTNDETPTDPMLQIPTTPKKKRQIAERFANKPLDPLTLAVGPLVPDRADHGIISTYDLDTPLLKELMKNLNVAERSRPAQQLRALRHFERGYWVVDVRAWSDDLRRSFWNFLAAFIYRGMGGWGVKAMRNAYEGSFTWVRLYGWGYLTQEMYMLLYLTSQRAVRGVGLRWYDAKHGVCVRMPTVAGGGPTGAQVRPGGPQVAPDPPLGDIADASGIDLEALMNNPAIPDGTTPPPGTPPAADNSQEAAAEGT